MKYTVQVFNPDSSTTMVRPVENRSFACNFPQLEEFERRISFRALLNKVAHSVSYSPATDLSSLHLYDLHLDDKDRTSSNCEQLTIDVDDVTDIVFEGRVCPTVSPQFRGWLSTEIESYHDAIIGDNAILPKAFGDERPTPKYMEIPKCFHSIFEEDSATENAETIFRETLTGSQVDAVCFDGSAIYIFQVKSSGSAGGPISANIVEQKVPGLLVESRYTHEAVREFQSLVASNTVMLLAEDVIISKMPLSLSNTVIGILNMAARRGYRPVASMDEDGESIEIESRLDPDNLLLLQVWHSGDAEGMLHSKANGFRDINATTADGVLQWLISQGFRD